MTRKEYKLLKVLSKLGFEFGGEKNSYEVCQEVGQHIRTTLDNGSLGAKYEFKLLKAVTELGLNYMDENFAYQMSDIIDRIIDGENNFTLNEAIEAHQGKQDKQNNIPADSPFNEPIGEKEDVIDIRLIFMEGAGLIKMYSTLVIQDDVKNNLFRFIVDSLPSLRKSPRRAETE